MNHHILANALRDRLVQVKGANPNGTRALSEDAIIDGYVVCAKCQDELFGDRDLLLRNAESVDEFEQLVDMAEVEHQCRKRIQGPPR